MTQDQLILFKELIKEAVRSAVKEAVKEELEASFKKDLKEVKTLIAKSIKESRENRPNTAISTGNPEDFRTRLREAVGSDFVKQSPLPIMSSEKAMEMSVNGSLPNIDAPIPFIKKDSIAWKEFKEKIG